MHPTDNKKKEKKTDQDQEKRDLEINRIYDIGRGTMFINIYKCKWTVWRPKGKEKKN